VIEGMVNNFRGWCSSSSSLLCAVFLYEAIVYNEGKIGTPQVFVKRSLR